jgi:alpha,alpha-trehalose phosphorylase
VLVHATPVSGLVIGACMDHLVDGPAGTQVDTTSGADLARLTVATRLAPGEGLQIVKVLAHRWSERGGDGEVRDGVEADLLLGRRTGWGGLVAAQRRELARFWDRADVEIEGDARLQQAVRFALFHTLQAAACNERQPIGGKGLTGPGYDGHAFWDLEALILPVLTYTVPDVAAATLRWRHRTLDHARARAAVLGLDGAAFPWRTIGGEECSGYWPASTAAFHVNADIADAVIRHLDATGDAALDRDIGVELLVETARLLCSLGQHDERGRFRLDGVTGPDEYSALADNNVYTNLMAQRNLAAAAAAHDRRPDRTSQLGVDDDEAARWRRAARSMLVPYDERLGVHPQAEGFTDHGRWDFASTAAEQYPLMLHFPYFDLYRKQVVKQADLVLALYRRGDAFTFEQKRRDFEYYEPITVRDSSLSACIQAIVAAEVGHVDLAYAYLLEAALVDLEDRNHNTRDGLHIASLAGAWLATVAGFGGLRDHDGGLAFDPRLPGGIDRLTFRLTHRGRRIKVEIDRRHATYQLLAGPPLELVHAGRPVLIAGGLPVTRRLTPVRPATPPAQPPHRTPGVTDPAPVPRRPPMEDALVS